MPMLHPQQLLHVYELKGGVPPPFLNLEGLVGIWPEADYTYLFFTVAADAVVETFVREHPEFHLTHQYKLRYDQWQDLAAREPLTVDRFRIITRDRPVHLFSGEILLRIDPGVIFGSGLHPTTRGCLRALSRLYTETRPARVLDLGTGSGILAIAAAKLGARKVVALDMNPIAISTAAANCRRNGVADRISLKQADAREQLSDAELLCVNIHFDFLRVLLETFQLCRYRWAILSGFLKDRLPALLGLLPPCARLEQPALEERCWITLIVKMED